MSSIVFIDRLKFPIPFLKEYLLIKKQRVTPSDLLSQYKAITPTLTWDCLVQSSSIAKGISLGIIIEATLGLELGDEYEYRSDVFEKPPAPRR